MNHAAVETHSFRCSSFQSPLLARVLPFAPAKRSEGTHRLLSAGQAQKDATQGFHKRAKTPIFPALFFAGGSPSHCRLLLIVPFF